MNRPIFVNDKIAKKYRLERNTFKGVVKNNPKDRIEREVGDSKQEDFIPQVKHMRWDNESNVSLRAIMPGNGVEEVITEEDKIIYKKGKYQARFYELPESEEHPEGAFEFDLVLSEKPDTNVFEFSLVDKNAAYYYQGELTPEEIAEGAYRPENVIGSYAIYRPDNPLNYVGGKEYKTGKIGHIYRPKVYDQNGNWVWGKLDIIERDGMKYLTVTVDWDFLNSAVYPVCVDPTLGHTSIGMTGTNWWIGLNTYSKYTMPVDADITSFSIYTNGSNYTIKMGFYDSNQNLAVYTNGVSLSGAGWKTGTPVSSTFLPSGTCYLSFIIGDGSNSTSLRYDDGPVEYQQTASTYPNFPASISFTKSLDRLASFYATYEEALGYEEIEISHTTDIHTIYIQKIEWVTPLDEATDVPINESLVFTIPNTYHRMHFHIQIDTANTFDTGNLQEFKSWQNQSNWEYYDGSQWLPIPSSGVHPMYAGNQARLTPILATGTYYRRARGRVVF